MTSAVPGCGGASGAAFRVGYLNVSLLRLGA
jgi:hypothetical protein